MHSLSILSEAQINWVKYVSQKVTLHRPDSIRMAMDGLFKYIGYRARFACALSSLGHLETVRLGARA